MSMAKTGILLALALTAAGASTASAATKYATDPDPFVYNLLGWDHRPMSHMDAIAPQTSPALAARAPRAVTPAHYATDPDPFIYNQLGWDHRAMSHMDALAPQTSPALAARAPRGWRHVVKTDPDPRIRSELARQAPSMLW